MPATLDIFNPQDKERLRKAKRTLTRALETLVVGEECGIDCQQRREKIKDALEVLDSIEAKLMPRL